MKAFVAGGAGFVGSHLVDRLLAEGYAVDAADDLSGGVLANLADARQQDMAEFRFHHVDCRSESLVELLERRAPDVLYLVTAPPPDAGLRQIADGMIAGGTNVLEAARRAGVPKVVVGCDALSLYGHVPARELPVKEGRAFAPASVQGICARALVELLAIYRDRHAVEFTALALASIYGPRQRPEGGVVAAFAAATRAGTRAVVNGDGRQTRDFVFVDDAVDAFVRAATRGSGLVVNIGTGVQTSIRDLHELLSGGAGPAHRGELSAGEVTRFALSPVRARIHLGWAPWTSLADGVAQLFAKPT
jgi:UDP-glucose 4-epimerase